MHQLHSWILVMNKNWNVILVFNEMRGRKIPQNAWWHLWVLYFRCYQKQGFQWPLGWHFQRRCSMKLYFPILLEIIWRYTDWAYQKFQRNMGYESFIPPPFSAKQWWAYHEVGEKRLLRNPCETLTLRVSNITMDMIPFFQWGNISINLWLFFSPAMIACYQKKLVEKGVGHFLV